MLYCFDDYVLDTERRELRRGPSAIPVEPLVFDLLAYLLANRERVVSKDDLRVAVWDGRIVSESTLGSSINAARTAIGDNGDATPHSDPGAQGLSLRGAGAGRTGVCRSRPSGGEQGG